jgi:hypothetical protein
LQQFTYFYTAAPAFLDNTTLTGNGFMLNTKRWLNEKKKGPKAATIEQ